MKREDDIVERLRERVDALGPNGSSSKLHAEAAAALTTLRSENEELRSSRELSQTTGFALELCARMALFLLRTLKRHGSIGEDEIECAFVVVTAKPVQPTGDDLAWAESVVRNLPPLSEAKLTEVPPPEIPEWLQEAFFGATPTERDKSRDELKAEILRLRSLLDEAGEVLEVLIKEADYDAGARGRNASAYFAKALRSLLSKLKGK